MRSTEAPNRAADQLGTFPTPPGPLRPQLGRLFLPFPLSRYSIVSREAAGQWWAESHSAGSRRFAGTAHAPYGRKRPPVVFSAGNVHGFGQREARTGGSP